MANPNTPYGFNDDASVNHDETLFCYDDNCPDREDQDRVGQVGEWYQEGLVSAEDADNIYHGRTV